MPPEVPALPSFRMQRAVSTSIVRHGLDYWTGTVYTTNRRVWEHDEPFKDYLRRHEAPTEVWYNAHAGLTNHDIERQHRVRKGLEAETLAGAEAQAWCGLL